MVYVQYERIKHRYQQAQDNYEELIKEKEDLFAKTQPKGQAYDQDRVSGGQSYNVFDRYIIEKDKKRIEERLEEARAIMEDRKTLLELKRTELERSDDVMDRIYYLKYIKRVKNKYICDQVGYSKAQVARYLKRIKMAMSKIYQQEI